MVSKFNFEKKYDWYYIYLNKDYDCKKYYNNYKLGTDVQ